MNYKNKIFSAFLIIIAGIVMIFKPNIPSVDNIAKNFIDNSIKESLISYAIIRGINAGVSVIKHSELEMEPAGVGVSVGVGEVLDPIDDLSERVSNLLFISTVVYGALEVIFNISIEFFYLFFPLGAVVLAVGLIFGKKKILNVGYFFLLISFIRFFFVIIAVGSNLVNGYIQKEITATENRLKIFSETRNSDFTIPKSSSSIWGFIKNKFDYVQNQADELKEEFVLFLNNASEIVSALIKLSYLYLGMFFINIILIPLLIYLVFRKILKVLYES